jgi:hypothetical protein
VLLGVQQGHNPCILSFHLTFHTSSLITCVTARPNLPYIVRFGPYRPHGFVPGDASPLLSPTPQNAYDKSATSTLNKVSDHSLTRQYGILQSTPLKKSDDPVGTTIQPVRLAPIPNVTARPNLLFIILFGPYRPHGFIHGGASPFLSLTPQNAYDKSATSTLNKASYHSLTRRCGILQHVQGQDINFIIDSILV